MHTLYYSANWIQGVEYNYYVSGNWAHPFLSSAFCKYKGHQPTSFSGVAIASAMCAGQHRGTKGKGKQKIIMSEIVLISPLYLALL